MKLGSVLSSAAFLCTVALATGARGAEPSVHAREARAAWDRGEYEEAERDYRIMVERGGLGPDEVLDAYVRLGSARAILGKSAQAIAAFRAAGVLDSEFKVPADAGDKAAKLAASAKKDVAKIGSIEFGGKFPSEVPASKAFSVTAELDAAHVPVIYRLGVRVRDKLTGKAYDHNDPPAQSVTFEIPLSMALSGASLSVRVDALDKFDNRLASVEQVVQVMKEPTSTAPVVPPKPGKSFWATPWPWVTGGVMLAAGAFSAYYFWLRPTDDVTFGPVGVRTR
ncbi:MAG: tetratricopeptide repeat protein [Polyangiaceae bacterium]